jgi:hypothetical protein
MENQEKDILSQDARVANLFQDLDRNYNNYPTLAASHLSEINVEVERRVWKDFAKEAVLGEDKTEPGKFYIKFQMGVETYEVQVDFSLTYKGVKNYDVAEPGYDYDQDPRQGVSLEGLSVKKIMVKSETIAYSSTKFSKDLGKTVLRFLLNIFKPLFDMIGDEALIIRQL